MRTVPATPELIPSLLERMGPARTAALHARCDGDARAAIAGNIAASTLTWCGLDDAGVVTMGGVLPIPEAAAGYVWQFIAGVVACKRAYIEQGRAMLSEDRSSRLIAIIETDNPSALRHARRMGFRLGPIVDFNGSACHFCERTRDV